MKRPLNRLAAIPALLAIGTLLTAAVLPDSVMPFHERKEVAGLAVVFGAEPEPALTEEMQQLVWRVSSLEDEEAYTDMADATVTITHEGESYGPFDVRGSRRNPGTYQTQHIFTAAGEYNSVLTFKKGEETESHSVDFDFRIRDRADLEIPRRGGSH
jgi:hypothetical protein